MKNVATTFLLALLLLSLWQWHDAVTALDELRNVHIPAAVRREADVRQQLHQCRATRPPEDTER